MTVQFTSIDEFLCELRRDERLVDRRIVRLAENTTREFEDAIDLRTTIVATARVGDTILRLDYTCHSLGDDVRKRESSIDSTKKLILDGCLAIALAVRDGILIV